MDHNKADLSIPTRDRVERIEFSPFEWSSSLILIAITNKITVGEIKFHDEEGEDEGEEKFKAIREIHHSVRADALAWSPQSSLLTVPKLIRFASADADLKIRVLSSDLCSTDETHVITGHCDYINDISFEPNHGEQIASVSDDHTCRVWGSLDGSSVSCFSLTSPGISVKWHSNDPSKLMVAEKKGIIRFYNLISNQSIMSLTCGVSPMQYVDWNPCDSLQVGCVASDNCYLWDISKSSLPLQNRQVDQNNATYFKFCPSNDKVYATIGDHKKQLKVFHSSMKQVLLNRPPEARIANFSWHYRIPAVAVGLDRKVDIFRIEIS